MRLWLVRHGATEWSEAGRLCGWTDIPLSPKGRGQAGLVRSRIHGQAFDGVWTSDLVRASEFARLVVGDATPDAGLRELDFGVAEGKKWHDLDQPTKDALIRFDGFAAPGGESVTTLENRIVAFLSGLVEGDHLIFTHGGVIRLLTRSSGIAGSPEPAEMTVVEWATSVQNDR